MTETVNSDQSLETVIDLLKQTYDEFKYLEIEIKIKGKARTNKQNAALHKWLSMLSVFLNDAGYDMKKTLSHHMEIPWDKQGRNAKELLFKPVLEALTGKESTAKADRVQYSEVREVLARHFADREGLIIPEWPRAD